MLTTILPPIIALLTPNSPAYGHLPTEFPQLELKKALQVGDIILSRTRSRVYGWVRDAVSASYDHIAVLMPPGNRVVHISPSHVCLVPVDVLFNRDRSPFVIRPPSHIIPQLIATLNTYLGKPYQSKQLLIGIGKEVINKVTSQKTDKFKFSIKRLQSSVICTDTVLYACCVADHNLFSLVEAEVASTGYGRRGFFLPDEVADILQSRKWIVLCRLPLLKDEGLLEETAKKALDTVVNGGKLAEMVTFFKKAKNNNWIWSLVSVAAGINAPTLRIVLEIALVIAPKIARKIISPKL